MKVRICYTETGTGEDAILDAEIQELNVTQVIEAIKRSYLEQTGELAGWAKHVQNPGSLFSGGGGSEMAFMFAAKDPYFGRMLFVGVVYTKFK